MNSKILVGFSIIALLIVGFLALRVFAANSAVLGVTGITAVQTYAAADGNYADGWKWIFDVTVPNNETVLRMKFSDWTNGAGGSIPAAQNMRFYSAQSSNAFDEDHAITVDAAGSYGGEMDIVSSSDLDPAADGIQIQIALEVRVPLGSANGSYSTSYGLQSQPPVSTVPATLTVGTGSGAAGSTTTISVAFMPSTTGVSSIQFDLSLPQGISLDSITAGDAANAAGKSVTTTTAPDGVGIILVGLNQNVVGTGTLANITLALASNLASGTYPMTLTNVALFDASANPVDATTTSGSLTVTATAPSSTPPVLSSDTSITSIVYTIGTSTITGVPASTTKATFLAALTKGDPNQTWDDSGITDPVATGNTLVVTAQDGVTKATYTITVTPPVETPTSTTPTALATLAAGTGSGTAGGTVMIPITFTPGPTGVTSLNFDLDLPQGVSFDSLTAGDAANTAGLTLAASTSTGGSTVTVLGLGDFLNPQAIGTGTLANITLDLASDLASGTYPLTLANVALTDTSANPVDATTTPGSVTVQ